jgi:hypothetical protein
MALGLPFADPENNLPIPDTFRSIVAAFLGLRSTLS